MQPNVLEPPDAKLLAAHAQLSEAVKALDEAHLFLAAAWVSSAIDLMNREFPQLSAPR